MTNNIVGLLTKWKREKTLKMGIFRHACSFSTRIILLEIFFFTLQCYSKNVVRIFHRISEKHENLNLGKNSHFTNLYCMCIININTNVFLIFYD